MTRGGTREASGMQETLYILSWAVVTQVCSLCNTNRAIRLRCMHFTVCILHENFVKNAWPWASLVAQWLRICLPMQGTRVRALVWEDPTCRGATRPVSHNY